jgi:hypothetical protein
MSLSVFSFIETFFFLSLAVSFVLILLLVYHFKQRITVLEHKNETMIRVMNDIVHELDTMKHAEGFHAMGGSMPTCFMGSFNVPFGMASQGAPRDPVSDQVEEVGMGFHDAVAEEDEDEDDEDDEDEDEDDDDEYEETALETTYDIDESVPKIVVSDSETPASHDTAAAPAPNDATDKPLDVAKMNVQALKQLAVSRGLVSDPSKMKKPELVALLMRHHA